MLTLKVMTWCNLYHTQFDKQFQICQIRSNLIDEYAKKILSNHAIKNILLTRSADGMSLINETETKQFSAKAIEVFDVSGAGDTVVAALAFGLGNGWTVSESIEFANIAAGIVVSKVGTATTTIEEIDAHESHL